MKQHFIPKDARPNKDYFYRICPRERYNSDEPLDEIEEYMFHGICSIGSEQLISCYGDDSDNIEYSREDFMAMCQECPYSLVYAISECNVWSIAEPYFILGRFFHLVDIYSDVPSCFVYFISNGEFVKIGVSENVERRMYSLQSASPRKLEILATVPVKNTNCAYELEKELHSIYAKYHIYGEWYEILSFLDYASFDVCFNRYRRLRRLEEAE